MIKKRVIIELENPGKGFYSRIFTVPKKSGTFRPVIDLSPLNKMIVIPTFKMESPKSIRASLRPEDYATLVDLTDAYFHFSTHLKILKYLRFVWKRKVFQFVSLPFGLSTTPLIFTLVTFQFATILRKKKVRIKMYLDDWLTLNQSFNACLVDTLTVVHLAGELGFNIKLEKSGFIPKTQFNYLGMSFDTIHFTVKPNSRQNGIMTELLHLARVSHTSPAKRSVSEDSGQIGLQSKDSDRPLVLSNNRSMARSILVEPFCSDQTHRSNCLPPHGQQPHRLGRSFARSVSPRLLVSRGEQNAYKFPRNASSPKLSPSNGPTITTLTCRDCRGQYNLSSLHQKPRRNSLDFSFSQSGGNSDMGVSESDLPINSIRTRSPECPGRQSQPQESNSSYGMVERPGDPSECLVQMGETSNRPVYNSSKSQTSDICLTGQRSVSTEDRRICNELGKSTLLCLPPNQPHSENSCENHTRKLQDDSHHTILARGNLVPRSNGSGDPRSSVSKTKSKPTNTTSVRAPSSKSWSSQSSRVATIRSKLLKKGYSVKAVSLALKAKRQSSCQNYSYKWKIWTNFCDSFKPRPIDPLHPKVSHFIEFITFLHEVKHLSYRTILNYRSAIANTIGSARGIQTSYLVSNPDVVQGIISLTPKNTISFPLWDLGFVLSFLRSDRFFPPEKLSLKELSQKTAFLILLASARRMSEIHALSGLDHNIEFVRKSDSVILSFLPEFRAKNEKAEEELKSIEIKSLKNFIEPDDPDLRNCPVSLLKCYLKRSHPRRKGQRRLFLSINQNYEKDIGKATIARWVKDLIHNAYIWAGKNPPDSATRVHEIRKLSASLSFHQSVSLGNILRAAFWRARSTFVACYLRDMETCDMSGKYQINSLIVSGSVLGL